MSDRLINAVERIRVKRAMRQIDPDAEIEIRLNGKEVPVFIEWLYKRLLEDHAIIDGLKRGGVWHQGSTLAAHCTDSANRLCALFDKIDDSIKSLVDPTKPR